MDVICILRERSNKSNKTIEIKNDYRDNNLAIITYEDSQFVVSIDEFISALNKVKLNCFGE